MADRVQVRLRGGSFDGWLLWAAPLVPLTLPVAEDGRRWVETYEYADETGDDGHPIMRHRDTTERRAGDAAASVETSVYRSS